VSRRIRNEAPQSTGSPSPAKTTTTVLAATDLLALAVPQEFDLFCPPCVMYPHGYPPNLAFFGLPFHPLSSVLPFSFSPLPSAFSWMYSLSKGFIYGCIASPQAFHIHTASPQACSFHAARSLGLLVFCCLSTGLLGFFYLFVGAIRFCYLSTGLLSISAASGYASLCCLRAYLEKLQKHKKSINPKKKPKKTLFIGHSGFLTGC
jgi:hypothetical protein